MPERLMELNAIKQKRALPFSPSVYFCNAQSRGGAPTSCGTRSAGKMHRLPRTSAGSSRLDRATDPGQLRDAIAVIAQPLRLDVLVLAWKIRRTAATINWR
jgi:hypothetical protein